MDRKLITWKDAVMTLVIIEMQIKTLMKYYNSPFGIAKIKETDSSSCCCGCSSGVLIYSGGHTKWLSFFGKQFVSFS